MTALAKSQSLILISSCCALGFLVVYVPPLLRRNAPPRDPTAAVARAVDPLTVDPRTKASVGDVVRAIGDTSDAHARRIRGDEPRAAAETMSTSAHPEDEDWTAIARSEVAFEKIVVEGPLAAARLLRNRDTNPRDQAVELEARSELTSYCRDMQSHLADLAQLKAEAAAADLQQLMARGAARSHALTAARSTLPAAAQRTISDFEQQMLATLAEKTGKTIAELRADPSFSVIVPQLDFADHEPIAYSVRQGIAYSATPAELPNANEVLRAQRWATFEVGMAIAQFFVQHGCLMPDEANRLMERLVAEIDVSLGG